MENRIYNFNAGPAALPLSVLEEIRDSFLNYNGSGMSVTEISHRSKWFDDIINDAKERIERILKLDEKFHVLFIQGGASMQFCMIPMNFLGKEDVADYVNTGTWSTKAIKEAVILDKKVNIAASSEDKNFSYIPRNIRFSSDSAYVHITSNNTIKGTQWASFPDTGGVPLIADMSSDIMCRSLDMNKFGLIYAGAQKNIGPAGVCMVIIHDDMLELVQENLPSMLDYTMKWLEEDIGGLENMEKINRKKAELLYGVIDSSAFYKGTAETDSRSLMNVTFRLPNEDLEKLFVQEALENGMTGLKGHRSVGGCRASIYNATTIEAVEALTDFMKMFEKKKG
jgi:phosphoserine aminotransferase